MAKKKENPVPETVEEETAVPEPETQEAQEAEVVQEPAEPSELEKTKAELAAEHDRLLRLAAEFDNYRSRTTREKERIYTDAKADTTEKFLPVYDNLARALASPTTDEAYKKGVELTMQGLLDILGTLGVDVFGEAGDAFDPAIHNAVMHVDDENLGENVIAEVFQKGFRLGEKIVRFAMVKVAN